MEITTQVLPEQSIRPPQKRIAELFILGNHIQALGLARMAAKIGLRVTVFNAYAASVARFSRACDSFVRYRDDDHLLELLLGQPGPRDTLLVATNDQLVKFMSDHYQALREQYFLSIPKPETVQICYNKRDTYRLAAELKIPIPDTWFPDSREELEVLADQVAYPVILKPAVMYTFHQATGKKVFFCRGREELMANYDRIRKIIPAEEVILQQFLKGGAASLYSFGNFFAEGEALGSLIANRIRQKPMDFGVSTCFARTVLNPTIERLSVKLLRSIGYFGMSEVEFMYDEERGEYLLLEVNPRAWKWHSIANKLDINLLGMMVTHLNGLPVERHANHIAGVGWIERLTDTYVCAGELLRGRMSWKEYRQTLRMPKESAAWSWKDPLPGIMYILMSPYLLLKR